MNIDTMAAFITYAFVTSRTPGPNNAMLLASGVQHGFVRTVPHIAGVSLGFALMFGLVGLGVGQVIQADSGASTVLRFVGAAYLLWMAWRQAHAGVFGSAARQRPPLSFLQAAGFQWANPKAWAMALGGLAAYLPVDAPGSDLLILSAAFALLNAPCVGLWAATGAMLARHLSDPRVARTFNLVAALLLALSVIPGLIETILESTDHLP